jgi:hypothetical protein
MFAQSVTRMLEDFSSQRIQEFDLMAVNGANKDIPPDAEDPHVRILRRHFPAVYRKRLHDRTVKAEKCPETGEDLWIVGPDILPRSAMIALAETYRDIPGRWRTI